MTLGSLVVGLSGLAGLLALLAGAMTLAARGVARLVGVPGFRWFEERPTAVAWWRMLCVRLAGVLAPFGVSVALFWVVLMIDGVSKPTTVVMVLEGAAREAGMLDGDRITNVAERPVSGWEEMRGAIQAQIGPTAIRVDRAGQPLVLVVTPRNGKIGVAPRNETERLGPIAAAIRAVPMPLVVVRTSAEAFLKIGTGSESAELRGPVSIVQETRKSADSGSFLTFMALLAAYLWPFAAGVALFDAVSSVVFGAQYPEAASSSLRGYRLERHRQALLLSCSGYVVGLLSLALVPHVPLALVLWLWAMPASAAGYPLIWIAGKDLWGRPAVALCMLVALVAPCVVLLVVALLLRSLSRALRAEGFRVTWFRAEPPSFQP